MKNVTNLTGGYFLTLLTGFCKKAIFPHIFFIFVLQQVLRYGKNHYFLIFGLVLLIPVFRVFL